MRTALLLTMLAVACSPDEAGPTSEGDEQDAGIDTPDDTWTWVSVPGTTCANGSTAGIGVYRTRASDDLFVYFQGGGACWDYASCFVDRLALHSETTYGQALLVTEVGGLVVDRTVTGNPLASATVVFVPYCTADLHAGDAVAQYTGGGATREMHHTGASNTRAFVAALAEALPGARKIWLAGSSAGGFGATLNLHRFAEAWPEAEVHLLQDSSPFVPVLANYAAWTRQWALEFPPGCDGCDTDFSRVAGAVAVRHPRSRIGLLHFDDDVVVKFFFGYVGSLVPATEALLADAYRYANTRAFIVAGAEHTMFGRLGTLVEPGGVRLADWVLQWARGDAAWATVRP